MIFDNSFSSNTWIVVALTALFLVLIRFASPSVDKNEPPIIKPRVPFIGHIISMLRDGSNLYVKLFKQRREPIATLPMLNGKLYVINSPDLIQSALRNNDISFVPFILESSQAMWGLSDNAMASISVEANLKGGMQLIHSTLGGESLHKLNGNSLSRFMTYLNRVKPGQTHQVTDTYLWLRDMLTDASATALFGSKNPITVDKMHLVWEYDKQAMLVAAGLPSFMTQAAINARLKMNNLLLSYYKSGDDDLAHMELMILWVGVTNTAPVLFWLFVHVLTSVDYTSRVRAEIEAIAIITERPEGRKATFDTRLLEKSCPFLNACYQETLRHYSHSIGNRRVMQDTEIQDAQGRAYLLKKGVNVQWPPPVTHFNTEIWGQDADVFKPERFMDVSVQDEKRRRGALLSFGGGKHLCPGRKFAYTELLGLVGVVALGFEVEGLRLPKSKYAGVGIGGKMPDWGSMEKGFGLRRREGWEDVTWTFHENN
ncbi:7-alpha-hydroxycholest-4-en-3-one 12-alpha-hydroxylase [Fusarium sporotrichioides]|uniref:7-alpha-hydroxycholest-4-en-3-one 12-alpha-hydroxylase n=1 Tax=Fusarium sporotrichioides TaxID=5514 RepID=A0A395S5G5_FUSSP|nr:7-alpha-hydroxycholest-4-en-3-one 12-alpha-hydroxylase [Fusarium sporotrichioides]